MAARAAIGFAVSAALVVAMLGAATRGFSALTTDSARALDVAATPVTVPRIGLLDMHRAAHTWRDGQRSTIVDFIYTRCVTVCSALGGVYRTLQSDIRARGLQSQVRLLSVSFDPVWDTPRRLAPYVQLMRADPTIWTIATVADSSTLTVVLQAFGVRVIEDGVNGYVHNAALHVVDPDGRLVAILPFDAIDEALDVAASHSRARTIRR
ncbi:SCO family protein [Gemmatimonas sp.]|uniref:SCO family protein n=1 Tax=Gemmatimonas sp. TaxID=1962908 RepID=UPI0039835D49